MKYEPITHITFDKKTNLSHAKSNGWSRNWTSLTVDQALTVLRNQGHDNLVSVQWHVYESASTPPVAKQNVKFIKRANKLAAELGLEVQAIDQINGSIWGCVLVSA